jgi:hypothetical protein
MPILTNPRHELFCQELAKGKSAHDAYVLAGYKESRKNAAALKSKSDIKGRLSELLTPRAEMVSRATQEAADEVQVSKAWIMSRLKENAERALQAVTVTDADGNIVEYKYEGNVANRALELLGKEIGMFIARSEAGAPGEFAGLNNSRDIEQLIAERLGLGRPRDAAMVSAREQGNLRGKPN